MRAKWRLCFMNEVRVMGAIGRHCVTLYWRVSDALRDQNLDLKEEKKEIEERLWNLEMMLKKHNFSRNIILISNSPETISTASSGFISNSSQPEKGPGNPFLFPSFWLLCAGEGELNTLPASGSGRLLELELETERLSDLLGVMEMREEQLVGEVRSQEEARREAERRLTSRLAGEELGRKMKKVLLLTAAFGAVHTALQHDVLAGTCTMLWLFTGGKFTSVIWCFIFDWVKN